jgi:trimeric autotransporter adhesin
MTANMPFQVFSSGGGIACQFVSTTAVIKKVGAHGNFAHTFGKNCYSEGQFSLAGGQDVNMIGNYNFSWGSANKVTPSATAGMSHNTLFGYNNTSQPGGENGNGGIYSTVLGRNNDLYDVSLSIINGEDITATQSEGSLITGDLHDVNKSYWSLVSGYDNTVGGSNNAVLGTLNTVTSDGSLTYGTSNTQSGDYSIAGGSTNNASGLYSATFGKENTNSGNYSIVSGQNNKATGSVSAIISSQNSFATGSRSAVLNGERAIAAGTGSLAIGDRSIAKGAHSIAIGKNALTGISTETGVGSDGAFSLGINTIAMGQGAFNVGTNQAGTFTFNVSSGGTGFTVEDDSIRSVTDATGQVTIQVKLSIGANGVVSSLSPVDFPGNLASGLAFTLSPTDTGTDCQFATVSTFKEVGAHNNGAVAMGLDCFSAGQQSFAGGANAKTSGNQSFAFGSDVSILSAESGGCVIFGNDSEITNDAIYATSFGNNNEVTGSYSFTHGFDNTTSGTYSAGIGVQNLASGGYSLAYGNSNDTSGEYSVGIGEDNTSSGTNSISLGKLNTSSGATSISLGDSNTVSGTDSVAIGKSNTVSGDGAIAIGTSNTASGVKSIAGGQDNNVSGMFSTVFGLGHTSAGRWNGAFGSGNDIQGDYSAAFGFQNTTIGSYCTAGGNSNTINGASSAIFGSSNEITGNGSFAGGNGNEVTGNYSTSFGFLNEINSDYSIAIGEQNEVSGLRSAAIGSTNTVSGTGSFASGISNTVSGDYSHALGNSNVVDTDNNVVVGTAKNTLPLATSLAPRFEVATGGTDGTSTGAQTVNISGVGSGYPPSGTYSTAVTSGGSGTGLQVEVIANFSTGAIISAGVVSAGSGYNVGDVIAITNAPQGSGGILTVGSLGDNSYTSLSVAVPHGTGTGNSPHAASGLVFTALKDSPSYADDAAAATGGVEVGELYHTSGVVKVRLA